MSPPAMVLAVQDERLLVFLKQWCQIYAPSVLRMKGVEIEVIMMGVKTIIYDVIAISFRENLGS